MNFIDSASIWDLHIHSNKCPKGKGSDFFKIYGNDTDAFLTDLIQELTSNEKAKVDMISFTDHNQISQEVYSKFYKREVDIKLIPGVEIDFLSNDNFKSHKHLIAYFDCDKEFLPALSRDVNNLLRDTRELGNYMDLPSLLNKLVQLGYNFIISPHAFKQEKRAIDYDWLDEGTAKRAASMYMDVFFVFWESSGYSSIQKGVDFLKEFNLKNDIPIVSFSDSNSMEKVRNYINNPPQYFRSLPTFKGLAMVGTDIGRITKTRSPFANNRNPGIIKEVVFGENCIRFSKQLNTIVGGRGSGKSILLDAIAHKLGATTLEISRRRFIENFSISINNYNDAQIEQGFAVDYFNQAYVNSLFSSKDFSSNLKEKFRDSFADLVSIQEEEIKVKNKQHFSRHLAARIEAEWENLDSFKKDYPMITNDGLDVKIQDQDKIPFSGGELFLDYKALDEVVDKFHRGLPCGIRDSAGLMTLVSMLKLHIIEEIKNHNLSLINSTHIHNYFVDAFLELKRSKSEISKMKGKVEDAFKMNIAYLSCDIIDRNNLVNAYFKASENFKSYHSEFRFENGSIKNRFIFSNELHVQSPLEYLNATFEDFVDNRRFDVARNGLIKTCEEFISNAFDGNLKEKVTLDELIERLKSYDLDYQQMNNIYYIDDDQIIDISKQSPGTQTNILMEYIVHKQTHRPLLIDQPEDNIDNKTIYDKFRVWFSQLKNMRQVIVVTHDANIVINADAENVIIAEQLGSTKFNYRYGALELAILALLGHPFSLNPYSGIPLNPDNRHSLGSAS